MLKNKKNAPEEEIKDAEPAAENTEPAPEDDGAQSAEENSEDIKKKLEEAQKQSEEYLNMAQRVQADFDNFRRRNKSVYADALKEGGQKVLTDILPVVDNMERALAAECSDEKLHEGVAMVYRQLMEVLTKNSVEPIERLGEKFDPALENAVMQGSKEEGEPGTVCAVFQKGYRMGDFVLRHAMVKVVAE